MLDRARHQFLGWWARFVSHRPLLVLAVAGLLAAASLTLTARRLTFDGDRTRLISQELDWNQRFVAWQEAFPGNADMVVLIDTHGHDGRADDGTRDAAADLAAELGPALAAQPALERVVWQIDTAALSPRALRMAPDRDFDSALALIESAAPLLESPTPQDMFARMARQMRDGPQADPAGADSGIRELAGLVDAMAIRMQTPAEEAVDLERAARIGAAPARLVNLGTPNGRFLLIRITPARQEDAITPYERALEQVRAALDRVASRYPEVPVGLTGIEVIEADETHAATIDSARASIVAAILIGLLLIGACHSVRTPLMILASLLTGMAWSFGFLTLVVGHLQVISVVFTAILLGLGVAFGIHLISQIELTRHRYDDDEIGFARSLQEAFETVGPGIVTGALTTAAAFITTTLTSFRGVAEMGLIAAGGVVLCMVAMFSVFPALLRLCRWRHAHFQPMESRFLHVFDPRWVMPFARRPAVTLVAAAVVLVASLAAITQMRFEYDLLSLLPRGVPSVQWAQRLADEGEQSIYFGVSVVDDLEEARQRAAALRQRPTVGELGGIGLLIPQDETDRLAAMARVRERMGPSLRAAQDAAGASPIDLVAQVGLLRTVLGLSAAAAPESMRPALEELLGSLGRFSVAAAATGGDERLQRLEALQRDFAGFRASTAERIAEALDPAPLGLSDAPRDLIEPITATIGGHDRYELSINPLLPEGASALDPAFLGRFVADMRRVDPEVTGVIVQIYEAARLIKRSYMLAGVYALAAVFVLLWIDFRRIVDAGLCLVPVALGFAVTFGILWLCGVQINPANIIVLPLMFGIGVDAGVHMIHRFRMDQASRPLGLSAATGKGISLTSYTAMIGFGSLMLASHRGIQSLGFVMTVGIAMTLASCWVVMPAWLEWRVRRHRQVTAGRLRRTRALCAA